MTQKIVPSDTQIFIPIWLESAHEKTLGRGPWLKSSRCPELSKFSVLVQGAALQDLLQSGLWDTDHKPLAPAVRTFLSLLPWALTQPENVWVVQGHAMLVSRNPGQLLNPTSENHTWPQPLAFSPRED